MPAKRERTQTRGLSSRATKDDNSALAPENTASKSEQKGNTMINFRVCVNWVTVCTLLLLTHITVFASYQAGADIGYEYLGNNSYVIHYSLYRDCEGIEPDDSVGIVVASEDLGSITRYIIPRVAGTGTEITNICPSVGSICDGGSYNGIQKYAYRDTVTISQKSNDWVISWEACCRNTRVSTLDKPGSTSFFAEAMLDNSMVDYNNSPQFLTNPFLFVGVNESVIYNHGAVDSDGDSLVYSIISARKSKRTYVDYTSPFNSDSSLSTLQGISLNALTGDISFTPTVIDETGIITIQVKEYRNGYVVGTAMREMQVSVLAEGNKSPQLTGVNGSGTFSINACVGQPVMFDIQSADNEALQNTYLTWNKAIDSADFNIRTGRNESATFVWTPKQSDLQAQPHVFTVTVMDDFCPYRGVQTYAYSIYVKDLPKITTPDTVLKSCNESIILEASTKDSVNPHTYLWEGKYATEEYEAHQFGEYTLQVTDPNFCVAEKKIVVDNWLDAKFSVDSFCLNTQAQFVYNFEHEDVSVIDHLWDFDNGMPNSKQAEPIQYFTRAQDYYISHTVWGDDGCTDTHIDTITLHPPLQPDLYARHNCINTMTEIRDTSMPYGLAQSFSWMVDSVYKGTKNNCFVSETEVTTLDVILEVADEHGCPATRRKTVHVNPIPFPEFTYETKCFLGAEFINTTTQTPIGIKEYFWHFGDSTFSYDENPRHDYENYDTVSGWDYNVSLVAINDSLCRDTISHYYKAHEPVTAFSYHNACEDSITEFTRTKPIPLIPISPIKSIDWTLGDGTEMSGAYVEHQYPGINEYTVTVRVEDEDGCWDDYTQTIGVNPLPNVRFDIDTSCVNSITGFTDQSTTVYGGMAYAEWSVGKEWDDIGLETYNVFLSEGVRTVNMTVYDEGGCFDSGQKSFNVNPHLTPDFSYEKVCFGEAVPFTNQSTDGANTIISNDWFYIYGTRGTQMSSDKDPNLNFYSTGYKTMLLEIRNDIGCRSVTQKDVLISKIEADYISDNVCRDSTAYFENTSVGTYGTSIVSQTWHFGDGTTATTPTAEHVYSDNELYNFKLEVEDAMGCSEVLSQPMRIYRLPVPDFSFDQICMFEEAILENETVIEEGDNIRFSNWDFGNGDHYPYFDAVVTYEHTGRHTIELSVTNGNGCTAKTAKEVGIFPKPEPSIVHDSVCLGVSTLFSGSAELNGSVATSWEWFQDSVLVGEGASANLSHNDTTLQSLQLIVKNETNCPGIASTKFRVDAVETDFTPEVGCQTIEMQFEDRSRGVYSDIVSWDWEFEPAQTQQVQNPIHKFSRAGLFNVELTATNKNGCSDTKVKPVDVTPDPEVRITMSAPCEGETVSFTPIVNSFGVPIQSWSWNLGDGTTSDEQFPTHIYNNTNEYTINLDVITDHGCNGSATYVETIQDVSVDFTYDMVCFGEETPLTGNNTTENAEVDYNTWSIRSTAIGNSEQLNYTFPNVSQEVTFKALTKKGCEASITKTVKTYELPKVEITHDPVCINQEVEFDVASSKTITDWTWSVESEPSVKTSTVSHTFTSKGNKSVSVAVVDINGCTGADFASPSVYFAEPSISVDKACFNTGVEFSGDCETLLGDSPQEWAWIYKDGTRVSRQNHSLELFDRDNSVTLEVTTKNGCFGSDIETVSLVTLPEVDFTFENPCSNQPTLFTSEIIIEESSIKSMSWNLDDFETSTLENPSVEYSFGGSKDVLFSVTNEENCVAEVAKQVDIYQTPIPSFYLKNQSVCQGEPLEYVNTTDYAGDTEFIWTLDFDTESTSKNPSVIYKEPGDYSASLLVITGDICRDSIYSTEFGTVLNKPDVWAGYDIDMIRGADYTLNGSATGDYYWTPYEMVSDSSVLDPKILADEDTVFILHSTDISSCGNTDTVKVRVFDGALVDIANTFTPNGDGLHDDLPIVHRALHSLDFYRVFDHLGHVVFETTDLNTAWDGTRKNGQPVDIGEYIVSIQAQDILGEVYKLQKTITVLY